MPTEKRMKYLARQAAKQADKLSDADRIAEYEKVMLQIGQLGLTDNPDINKFDTLFQEWVKDGKFRQGVIPVDVANRDIIYSLGVSRRHFGIMFKARETTTTTDNVAQSQDNIRDSDSGDEQIPELITVPDGNNKMISKDDNKSIKGKKKFIQGGPRGSRAAIRAAPAMKPKAQSA